MPMTREQIVVEARSLPFPERKKLMEDLRQIGDDSEISEEQRAELRRRVAAVDRGEMKTFDGEQAMQELLSGLRRR